MAEFNMIIGLPGSGKTTYCKEHFNLDGYEYISSDAYRITLFGFENQNDNQKLFQIIHKDIIEILKRGKSVIFDATNTSYKYRKVILDRIKTLENEVEINAYFCCTPINEIIERTLIRSERQIPLDKINLLIKTIDIPMYYEGFNNIYLIDGSETQEDLYEYERMLVKCKDFNQDNPYHSETLEEHIKNSAEMAEQVFGIVSKDNGLIIEQAIKYHDFGKLFTKAYNQEKKYSTYYGHEKVSAYLYCCHLVKNIPRDIKDRSRLGTIKYNILVLIYHHMDRFRGGSKRLEDKGLLSLLNVVGIIDSWNSKRKG